MNENSLTKHLSGQHSRALQAYQIYLQSIDIYRRTQIAMGRVPGYVISTANSQNVKVQIDKVWSSKILTCS